jgi:hypothetical protein
VTPISDAVNRVANTNPITICRRQPFTTLCIYRGPRVTFNIQTSYSLSAHGLAINSYEPGCLAVLPIFNLSLYAMPNTYKSPAVILNEPSNWEEWIFIVKIRAQPLDTWQYLDLDLTVSPGVLANLAPLPL